ncbi:MAG: hypothetical protein JOZ69_19945, partial [Myxococcales bacterium]|nr:hypothetical protein [Myxococcales bacterium]
NIAPIMQASCISCHGGAGGLTISYANLVRVPSQEVRALDYVTPGSPGTSYFYCKINPTDTACTMPITGSQMPPGPALSTGNLNLIKNWIQQGAMP